MWRLGSSLDLKRAHNPKVAGSNPAPATIENEGLADVEAANRFRLPRLHPGIGWAWPLAIRPIIRQPAAAARYTDMRAGPLRSGPTNEVRFVRLRPAEDLTGDAGRVARPQLIDLEFRKYFPPWRNACLQRISNIYSSSVAGKAMSTGSRRARYRQGAVAGALADRQAAE